MIRLDVKSIYPSPLLLSHSPSFFTHSPSPLPDFRGFRVSAYHGESSGVVGDGPRGRDRVQVGGAVEMALVPESRPRRRRHSMPILSPALPHRRLRAQMSPTRPLPVLQEKGCGGLSKGCHAWAQVDSKIFRPSMK